MNQDDRDKKIEETHDVVIQLKTVILGIDGDPGLVGLVESNTRKINKITIILAGLIGTGLVTGGSIGISHLIS